MLQLIWHVPEGFATLAAGTVAIVAAVIAWFAVQRQIRAAQKVEATKLRLDLYNRRYQIFESIFDFYDALWQWAGTPEQKAAQQKFFRASEEAGFLFSNESGVQRVMKQLLMDSGTVIGFKEHGEDYRDQDRELYQRQHAEMNRILTTGFEDGLLRLRLAMAEYLNFQTVEP
jgi:hypothetical protein